MKKIVFDIETRNTFQEVGAREPEALDLSVISIYDYETDKYSSYTQENLSKLWPLFEKADLIIGFNSDYFDIPILNKYYPGDLAKIKSLDILSEVKKAIGKRISLDSIAAGTLGREKIAHGLQAVEWWKAGNISDIIKYCEEDVHITKDIYDYARANNSLKYKMVEDLREFNLDASKWEEVEQAVINYTLPF